jgi:hypothetical protein
MTLYVADSGILAELTGLGTNTQWLITRHGRATGSF